MTNTRLQELLARSEMTEADRRNTEIIFEALSPIRKTEVLRDWSRINGLIIENRARTEENKRLLLMQAIETIETDLGNYYKELVSGNVHSSTSSLKQQIYTA